MIPQISGAIVGQIQVVSYPTKTYKITGGRIIGYTDGLDAMRQAVFHILSIERYAYAIYDDNYGVELEQYKSRGYNYFAATIQNTLRDALLQDDRIVSVNVIETRQVKKDSAYVLFDVVCDKETFGLEIEIYV